MTARVSLVVTDLDGTFWHTDDQIHPDVVKATVTLAERGIPLLVATGRRLGSTRRPLARVGLTPPAIVLNGALGVDLSTGDRFHVSPYPPGDAARVLDAFQGVGIDPVVYVDDPDIEAYVSETPSTHPEHVRMLRPNLAVSDLREVVTTQRVLGFSLIGVQHGLAVAARDAIGDLAETHLDRSIDFAGFATFTVAPNSQSKWDGVAAFCERNEIDPTRVLAIGDGTNDVELLTNAAVALAPSDGHSSVTEIADAVVAPAATGGWVEVLNYL
ncbi:MAG: HAD family phosphatase [Microthrixaceae bacterium]|nr:HAD family phosphatase [Microthrixaceae bacterium]